MSPFLLIIIADIEVFFLGRIDSSYLREQNGLGLGGTNNTITSRIRGMKMKEICLQKSSNHPLKETWTWWWSIFAACMFLRWIEVLIEISQPVTSSLHFKRKIETAHSSWCSRVRWIHFYSFINQTTVEIKHFHFTMHYAPVCTYQILEWRFLLPVTLINDLCTWKYGDLFTAHQ